MEYKNIIFSINENVAVITFNNPKTLNALNMKTFNELEDAINKINNNADIKALILTGTGKAFIAGADIAELAKFNALEGKIFSEKGQAIIGSLEELPIPVIAAVNGFALGGGCEMALAADFIYAANTAKFGLPEIKLGLIPGFGGTQRLARQVGKNLAKELVFTGKMIDAKTAKNIGLANEVFASAKLMEETYITADLIASKGKTSLCAAKQSINCGVQADLKTACQFEANAFAICLASEDAKEGTSAFLKKRKAVFKGKLGKSVWK
ncbi:MAG: enoyl-CoA hydratase/isomerase family protein [Deltaproteobacteria bacterium]|nr:enoyl-CoA hydratase/isomerase family protein [Deltaproteobacteria bacterium]